MRGWLGEERWRLSIVQEVFGWGYLFPCKLYRTELVEWGEKRPWCVEIVNLFVDNLVDIFEFFNDD